MTLVLIVAAVAAVLVIRTGNDARSAGPEGLLFLRGQINQVTDSPIHRLLGASWVGEWVVPPIPSLPGLCLSLTP